MDDHWLRGTLFDAMLCYFWIFVTSFDNFSLGNSSVRAWYLGLFLIIISLIFCSSTLRGWLSDQSWCCASMSVQTHTWLSSATSTILVSISPYRYLISGNFHTHFEDLLPWCWEKAEYRKLADNCLRIDRIDINFDR